ncbi:hypothetical protein Bca52824_089290 [Brassica carinata]|uniref:Zinc knuckle CX2CX4HX4C domain-containing protein n=1 Tax=Brassica carinata TaxID=52824 RepID=A0A8X7TPL9_BRACI|nr:hypothetical protein Bca52824_089290 [Brassica carinata]
MVLNKRPCHFNHWIFALERWEPFTSDNFPNTVPFWIKVTGIPVHYWNDQTFDEIAKALGKRVAIDSRNARMQVSIDAEKPLQFERRVGFPNGDVGRVYLEYEGLIRHCFACNRIAHDVYSCPELTQEEREDKIKEYRENNGGGVNDQQNKGRLLAKTRSNNRSNNKRPRSPSDEGQNRSPSRSLNTGFSRGEKRSKDSASYWTSRNQEDPRKPPMDSEQRRENRYDRFSSRNASVWNRLDGQHPRRTSESSDLPRKHQSRGGEVARNRGRDYYSTSYPQNSQRIWRSKNQESDSRSNNRSRLDANTEYRVLPSQTMTDSQQTISEALPRRSPQETTGNGVLVVHRNETAEERKRRLKGKAPMHPEPMERTPISTAKNPPLGLLTRNRGVISIRSDEDRSDVEASRWASKVSRKPNEIPVHTETCLKEAEADLGQKKINSNAGKEGASRQGNTANASARKRLPQSPSGKGTRASRKMNYPRGRLGMKISKETGTQKKSKTADVPHIEVFPSTKSKNSSSLAGSVGSQKPPSKKI